MKAPLHVSEAVKRLNPHLWPSGPMGGLQISQPEPAPTQTLVRCPKAPKARKRGVEAVVTIIACRRRLLDSDNSVASNKFIRDAISEAIGCDDGDPRIRWEHEQIETRGKQGTLVKIELL